MYNLKYIRSNNENFKKKIKERNINLDVDTLLKLDKQNRELILEKEKLLHEKKLISKKNDTSLFKRSKEALSLFLRYSATAKPSTADDFTPSALFIKQCKNWYPGGVS